MALLFEPMTLRELTVKNRIWLSPMCQYSVEARDGVPTDWHLVHLGARAQGGFGLIMTEATAVTADGRISAQDTGLWNDTQQGAWERIVSFVHSQQAAAGVQLAHAGRKASTYRAFAGELVGTVPAADGGWQTVAPSPIAFDAYATPRELSRPEIDDIMEAFAASARRADDAGFDVVELHSAHGYLLHQFLSPLANRRTDGYGGDFTGRTRLLLEVTEAVREVWPAGKPLFVRLSATDWLDGGWDVEQSARLASLLSDRGVDLIDVSSGGIAPAQIPIGPAYQVPLAARVRQDSGIATSAVGLLLEPDQAEQVLRRGDADAVMLARAALREPAWPLRAASELGLDWRQAPYPAQYTRGKWDDVPALV